MRQYRHLPGVLSVFLLSACATMFSGTTQDVGVGTVLDQPSTCILVNGSGEWSAPAPSVVRIQKSEKDLNIYCVGGNGSAVGSYHAAAHFDGWAWANVFNAFLGMIVDSTTGAMYYYDEPFMITMVPSSSVAGQRLMQSFPASATSLTTSLATVPVTAPEPTGMPLSTEPAPVPVYSNPAPSYPAPVVAVPQPDDSALRMNPTYKPADAAAPMSAPSYASPAPVYYPPSAPQAPVENPAPAYTAPAYNSGYVPPGVNGATPAVLDPTTGTYYYPGR